MERKKEIFPDCKNRGWKSRVHHLKDWITRDWFRENLGFRFSVPARSGPVDKLKTVFMQLCIKRLSSVTGGLVTGRISSGHGS